MYMGICICMFKASCSSVAHDIISKFKEGINQFCREGCTNEIINLSVKKFKILIDI